MPLTSVGKPDCDIDTLGIVRGILLILKEFQTVDELLAFIEEIKKKPTELPESLLDNRSIFHSFMNSPMKEICRLDDEFGEEIYPAYTTIVHHPLLNEKFKTTKHRRFLMHLIGNFLLIPMCTADFGCIMEANISSASTYARPLMMSYLKHSCDPNVFEYCADGRTVWFSGKPIKKGEQLCITHFEKLIQTDSIKERQNMFFFLFQRKCACSRCQGGRATEQQRQQLLHDPAYHFITANAGPVIPYEYNSEQIEPLLNACTSIMQRYGQMEWCDELAFVCNWFRFLFKYQSLGGEQGVNHPLIRKALQI